MTKLKKGAYFTDIHFGKKQNSRVHNQDCLDFIDWFCEQVKRDPEIDYIAFLGDWNENRSALNISTVNYSHKGISKLCSLGLPVYFVIGNHDLYHRHTREVHSVITHDAFKNLHIIDQPTVVDDIEGSVMFCPFMFPQEYPDLVKYLDVPFWAGHFEFKGFLVTGYNLRMPHGPDPDDFKGPNHIVSGHFHTRQAAGNVVYMGNAFPMDFNDAGDFDRGMMVYDHKKDEMVFENWPDCPKYIKTLLSSLMTDSETLYPQSRVKVCVDIPITFEESGELRELFKTKYELREFTLEEMSDLKEVLADTETEEIDWENVDLADPDDLVIKMLEDIESDEIDNDKMIAIYATLKTEEK